MKEERRKEGIKHNERKKERKKKEIIIVDNLFGSN